MLHASYLLPAIYCVCNKPQYNSPSFLFELQQFKLLTAFLWLGSLGDAPGDAPTPCLMLVSLKWCRTGHAGSWHAGCEAQGWQHGRTAHGTARLCPSEHRQISKLTLTHLGQQQLGNLSGEHQDSQLICQLNVPGQLTSRASLFDPTVLVCRPDTLFLSFPSAFLPYTNLFYLFINPWKLGQVKRGEEDLLSSTAALWPG